MSWLLRTVIVTGVSVAAIAQQNGVRPAWAFPVPDKEQPAVSESSEARKIPGSAKSYTPEQIDDLSNPPIWFPEEVGQPPTIVQKGTPPNALACGSCHLMSGHGHPESADIAGMPAEYLVKQMAYFKSGVRKDPARMNGIAKAASRWNGTRTLGSGWQFGSRIAICTRLGTLRIGTRSNT